MLTHVYNYLEAFLQLLYYLTNSISVLYIILQLKFIQEKRAMKVDLSFECGLEGEGYKLVTVGVACQPLCVRIEDSLVQSLVKTIDSYLTMASLLPATSDNCAQVSNYYSGTNLHNNASLKLLFCLKSFICISVI